MIKSIYVRTFSLLLMLTAFAVQAEETTTLKVGYVDPAKLLQEAPQYQEAQNRFEQEFAPRDREIVEEQKQLRKLEDKLARDGTVMSEEESTKLERDILNRKREIRRKQDEYREDANIRRNEEFSRLQKFIGEAIISLGKKEKYDLIVSDGVVFASSRLDITDQVLELLKKNP